MSSTTAATTRLEDASAKDCGLRIACRWNSRFNQQEISLSMPGAWLLLSPTLHWLDWSLAESSDPSPAVLASTPDEPASLIIWELFQINSPERVLRLCLGVGEDEAVVVVTIDDKK